MNRRGIILMLLAMVFAGSGQSLAAEVPASQDVYVSLGTGNETIYNQTETLLCAINVPYANNATGKKYTGVPIIQFNLSDINITDDDVAILVLKAVSVRLTDRSSIVALVTIGSDWDEESDLTTFLVNILPARNQIKENDLKLISTNSDGDDVYAFDVSGKLRQARGRGDKISFLLEAIGNSTTEIDFLSRESGQGPYLMIMPYPGLPISGQIKETGQADQENQTVQDYQNLSPESVPGEALPVQTFGLISKGNESHEKMNTYSRKMQGNQDSTKIPMII